MIQGGNIDITSYYNRYELMSHPTKSIPCFTWERFLNYRAFY